MERDVTTRRGREERADAEGRRRPGRRERVEGEEVTDRRRRRGVAFGGDVEKLEESGLRRDSASGRGVKADAITRDNREGLEDRGSGGGVNQLGESGRNGEREIGEEEERVADADSLLEMRVYRGADGFRRWAHEPGPKSDRLRARSAGEGMRLERARGEVMDAGSILKTNDMRTIDESDGDGGGGEIRRGGRLEAARSASL